MQQGIPYLLFNPTIVLNTRRVILLSNLYNKEVVAKIQIIKVADRKT